MRTERIGEKHMSNCGLEMEIIAYRRTKDLDVRFQDGVVVKNKTYTAFINGKIKHPEYSAHAKVRKEHLHERRQNKIGLWMEIIEYRKTSDIDVRFDDGSVAHHKRYTAFLEGTIAHPEKSFLDTQLKNIRKELIGKRNKNAFGLWMEIIAYNSATDIRVRFDDGAVVDHRTYNSFLHGDIGHPVYTPAYMRLQAGKDKYEGMEKTATNGTKMKIVCFRSTKDIDVLFSDGTLAKHKDLHSFLNGGIYNPNDIGKTKWEGKIYNAKNGLKFKVLHYYNSKNMTIQFEDGTIKEGVSTSSCAESSSTAHPHLSQGTDHLFFGVKMSTKPVFRDGNKVFYICNFPDGTKDICTPQQVMKRMNIPSAF